MPAGPVAPVIGPAYVPETRRSARLAGLPPPLPAPTGPVALRRTKSPRITARSHLFRVNIERGWIHHFVSGVHLFVRMVDGYIGGTY
jgi:hypothetical protein